jgi:hypothetical protein
MNSARRILAAAAVLVGTLAAPAFAAAKEAHHDREPGDHHRVRHSIPEFDPASIGAIAAIVAGGGILIARRRSR